MSASAAPLPAEEDWLWLTEEEAQALAAAHGLSLRVVHTAGPGRRRPQGVPRVVRARGEGRDVELVLAATWPSLVEGESG